MNTLCLVFIAALGSLSNSNSAGLSLRSSIYLHGREVDVLDGGNLLLQYNRARYYDIKNGRWLHRDRAGYVDGANLYESFGSNPSRLVDPSGMDWFAELLIGSAGKNVSTTDVIFSSQTADALTFGLFNFTGNSADQARYAAARRLGVVSPTITAGEIALTGPTGSIRGFVARNVATGVVFGSGEFARDLLVNDRVQTPGQFATNTAIFTGAGATLEGVFVAGGRVLAYFRQGTQVAVLDVTEQVAASAASHADPLLGSGVGQLLSKSQAQAGAQTGLGEITLAAAGTGEPVALILRPTQLELNQALGATFEQRARSFFTGQGYTVLETQFPQGAVQRGLDFAAFRSSEQGIELLLVEAKATAGNVVPSRFTSLGLGRGGPEIFRRNLLQVQTAIRGQVIERALQRQLIQSLEQGSSIRLIGPSGFRITQSTTQRIQSVTERNVGVIALP